MQLEAATQLAQNIARSMQPFCELIQIAGSIRRRKPEVKDIEIVCAPCWFIESTGLPFDIPQPVESDPVKINLLYKEKIWQQGIRWIKPGVPDIVDWKINPQGKYWRGYLPKWEIKLDVFLCEPDNFGLHYLIRTGSAEFSKRMVTELRYQHGLPVRDGWLWSSESKDAAPIPTREEQAVFDLCKRAYVRPKDRNL